MKQLKASKQTRDAELGARSTENRRGGMDFDRRERAAHGPKCDPHGGESVEIQSARETSFSPRTKRPMTEAEQYLASLTKIDDAVYLNAAVPKDHATGEFQAPLEHAVCRGKHRCGHGYSHMIVESRESMRTKNPRREYCQECLGEDWEEYKAEFARELGLRERSGPNHEWMRAAAHRAGVIGRAS